MWRMDRTDSDTIMIVAGVVLSLVALAELYPLLKRSDAD